jgi:predicted tellurium resistance membrane protein TerC
VRQLSGLKFAVTGMLTLAVAIGVGRFAFTPIRPMMQKDAGLSLAAAVVLTLAAMMLTYGPNNEPETLTEMH